MDRLPLQVLLRILDVLPLRDKFLQMRVCRRFEKCCRFLIRSQRGLVAWQQQEGFRANTDSLQLPSFVNVNVDSGVFRSWSAMHQLTVVFIRLRPQGQQMRSEEALLISHLITVNARHLKLFCCHKEDTLVPRPTSLTCLRLLALPSLRIVACAREDVGHLVKYSLNLQVVHVGCGDRVNEVLCLLASLKRLREVHLHGRMAQLSSHAILALLKGGSRLTLSSVTFYQKTRLFGEGLASVAQEERLIAKVTGRRILLQDSIRGSLVPFVGHI